MNSSKSKRPKTRVEVYSKPDCHLCDDAKAVLLEVGREFNLEIREIDITRDPELFEQYKHAIPVVFIDGRKAFKYRVDKEQLRKRLRRLN
ncbi:MAG: glutaredoxin family protein [Calditrichaeota bacterium]|nr:MAG: glutaredoxin family protein [Calditrichota bacterium]